MILTTHLYGYKIFLFLKISSPTTVLLASLFPRTYISFLKGNLFSFENNCWEACLRKGIKMFLLHFEKTSFSPGISVLLYNRISMKSGRGGQGLAGKHIFCEMWNPATVPGRCGAKQDAIM